MYQIKDVIEMLSKLDPELHLCGYADDETVCLASEVSEVMVADIWHDALPVGARHVFLRFNGVIPHVRGEGAFAEQVPPPPPPVYLHRCEFCGREQTGEHPMSCRKCSWRPMMKEVMDKVRRDEVSVE